MEKEEQKWEQEEVEEQQEEESAQLVRKSRAGNESKDTETPVAVDVEVSNGISEGNGHLVEPKTAENGAHNGELTLEEEQKIEELDGVLEEENGSEALIEEQKSENLVFYDKPEGVKSTSTYSGEEKQIVKDAGQDKLDVSSVDLIVQNNSTSEISTADEGNLEKNSLSSSNIQPSQVSFQEHSEAYNKSPNEIESAEVDISEDDLEVAEFDVERVIKKQNTHDLFCPNCNSCITRRVILRKRKRRVRITEDEVKRNKIEGAVGTKLGAGAVHTSGDQVHHSDEVGFGETHIPREDDAEHDTGPDIFRCLSCFSFFIPCGNGFKLFFGKKGGKENVRDEQVPNVKKNWFTSMFASNKQESTVQQGSSSRVHVQEGHTSVQQSSNLSAQSGRSPLLQNARSPNQDYEGLLDTTWNFDALEGRDKILPSPGQKPSLNGNVTISAGTKSDTTATERTGNIIEQNEAYTSDQPKGPNSRKEVENGASVVTPPKRTEITNGESVEEAISFPQQDGLKFLIEGKIPNQTIQLGGADKDSNHKASDINGKLNISVAIPHEEQGIRAAFLTRSEVENNANFKTSDGGQVYPTEISQHIITETKLELHSEESVNVDNLSAIKAAAVTQGKDTVITIDTQPAGLSQPLLGTKLPAETGSALQSTTQVSITHGERTEARKEFEIEVIKSIVYGGLAESITSLSVVSSAAGGGAATLNVIAVGMANLVGGLFIIFHNLWELKSDRIEEVSNQVSNRVPEQQDRYKQLLGRRENFIIHAIIAIISYIIFGLVPPLVYGFSFRKTDDKELKLVVVAASSLLCIILLAIGRAYVRRPPKPYLKSLTTYVILGFLVSGISYAAGVLIERLLEKLGLFEPNTASGLLLPEMTKGGSAWASF